MVPAAIKNINYQKSIVLFVLMLLTSTSIQPHSRSESFSEWHITSNSIRAIFTVSRLEASRINTNSRLFLRYITNKIEVLAGEMNCKLAQTKNLEASTAYLRYDLRYECNNLTVNKIKIQVFFNEVPFHLHYAKIFLTKKKQVRKQYVLTNKSNSISLETTMTSQPSGFFQVILNGVLHILTGTDHVLFLLGLLLLATDIKAILMMATGFTLGHSISLALAASGVILFDANAIESLIGFTIFMVAAEYLLIQPRKYKVYFSTFMLLFLFIFIRKFLSFPFALGYLSLLGLLSFSFCYYPYIKQGSHRGSFIMTSAFGLIHGFGFSSVLKISDISAWYIASFNVGVEIGQIFIIAICWPVIRLLIKKPPALDYLASALAVMGLFWFVSRAV